LARTPAHLAGCKLDPRPGHLRDGFAGTDLDAHVEESFAGMALRRGCERLQQVIGHLDENDARPVHLESGEVLPQHHGEQL
jgi:hypothetical protein